MVETYPNVYMINKFNVASGMNGGLSNCKQTSTVKTYDGVTPSVRLCRTDHTPLTWNQEEYKDTVEITDLYNAVLPDSNSIPTQGYLNLYFYYNFGNLDDNSLQIILTDTSGNQIKAYMTQNDAHFKQGSDLRLGKIDMRNMSFTPNPFDWHNVHTIMIKFLTSSTNADKAGDLYLSQAYITSPSDSRVYADANLKVRGLSENNNSNSRLSLIWSYFNYSQAKLFLRKLYSNFSTASLIIINKYINTSNASLIVRTRKFSYGNSRISFNAEENPWKQKPLGIKNDAPEITYLTLNPDMQNSKEELRTHNSSNASIVV